LIDRQSSMGEEEDAENATQNFDGLGNVARPKSVTKVGPHVDP